MHVSITEREKQFWPLIMTYSPSYNIRRMEKVKLKRAAGIAKVVGMMVCIAGAAILGFYKGPYLKPLLSHQLFHQSLSSQSHHSHNSQQTWIIGCSFLLVTSISWGIWFVLQVIFQFRV